MTNFNYCRKIFAGCFAMLLVVNGAIAFQQATTSLHQSRKASASLPKHFDATRLSELRLHSRSENDAKGNKRQPGFLLYRQAQSRTISSTRLSVTANRGFLGIGKNKSATPDNFQGRLKLGILTVVRVVIPSVLAGAVAFYAFPALSLWLCSLFQDAGVFAVLSQDSSQFVQNFLSVSSLLFSILVGQTYYFMYQQQEMVYYALFDEVTEAKSLLEQVALVSQGRSMYQRVLSCMSTYVNEDLKALDKDPAILLSSRPMDDPLETIMYLVSPFVNDTIAYMQLHVWLCGIV